jgi:hypothetical protein
MQDGLLTSNKKPGKVVPFVCTYNPSLPNISKVINQYWNLFKYSKYECFRQLLTDEPFIAYTCKRPKNIQDILVQSKLNN